ESPTEITIEVTSDLKAPTEIDRVDIDVTNLLLPLHASADLTKQDLPRHLTLVRDSGPLGPIHITVAGYLGATKLVQRIVRISFAPRNSKSLAVRLERACLANFCEEDTTCVSGRCRAYAGIEPDDNAGHGGDDGTGGVVASDAGDGTGGSGGISGSGGI